MRFRARIFDALSALLGGLLLTCIVALRTTASDKGLKGILLVVAPASLGMIVCVYVLLRRRGLNDEPQAESIPGDATATGSYRHAPSRAERAEAPSHEGRGGPAKLLFLVSLPLLVTVLVVAAFALLSRYFWFGPG